MLRIILAALPVIIVVFLIVVALQPSEYRVARSATISAPPAPVFAQVNDCHKWEAWNPWGKMDPRMKQTFEGARRPEPAASTAGPVIRKWAKGA